jgi:signal transduction histidine kinase
MTADLIAAKVKAEENDNLKTAFLQNLSHEIRTPLNGIIGYTQLLQLNEVSNESRVNYSKIIHTSGKRLIDIVNNVLELSKIETGQSQVVPTNVNLNHIIDELYNFFLLQAQSKGLELIKDVPENSNENEIYTDESKLNQILINLIGNAIKFTEFGKVRYGFKFESDFVELFVIDTGVGIHDDFKDSVFDRFRQGDTHLSRDYEGAGLGLAICKGFVDLLGGKINFTSQKGIGTTFYFQIPRVLF